MSISTRIVRIAAGSLAFAVTVGRPFPKRRDLPSAEVERRVRIACGLAVSGAVLGLSQWASVVAGEYLGDDSVPDASVAAMSSGLIGYAVLVSVFALVVAFATRGGGRSALAGGETTPPMSQLLPPPAGESAR